MTGEELKVKLEKLVENEAFLGELKQAESKEDLKKTFAKYGIELTKEEIDAFTAEIEKVLENDELSENALEGVAGGVAAEWIFVTAVSWGKAIWKKCWGWGKKFANWEDGK